MPEEDSDLVLPEGLRRRPIEPVRTKFGTFKKCGILTRLEISFLVIALFDIAASLAFSVTAIVNSVLTLVDSPNAEEDLILAIVLTMNIAFCLTYIMLEKPYELIAFMIAVVIVTIYVIANYVYRCGDFSKMTGNIPLANITTTPTEVAHFCANGVKLSRLIITVLLSPPAIIIGGMIARDYIVKGEFVFRIVGADGRMQTACKIFYAAIGIIKLDLQLQLSMLIFILHEEFRRISLVEGLILGIGVPVSIAWAIGSFLSIHRENSKLLLVVVLTAVLEPAYISYRLYIAVKYLLSLDNSVLLSMAAILFGAGALVVRGVHCILLFLCWRNFGKGLKDKFQVLEPTPPNQATCLSVVWENQGN